MFNADEIRILVSDERRLLSEDEISEALLFFTKDSEGEAQFIPEFVCLAFMAERSKGNLFLDEIHLCNQRYIANIKTKPELKRDHLPYLYIREINYYTMVDSYSECLRCINKVLELENAPDFCTAAALTQVVDIFMNCGLTNEAERYIESMRVFTNICDLGPRQLIMLDCNLMQAFALMGKRKEYEFHRRAVTKYPEKELDPSIISLSRLYILGSEAIIDYSREPSLEYIRQFTELMENGCFESDLSADYAEVMVPILKWLKNRVPLEKLIRYTIHMIEAADSFADKIEMYSVLTDDFMVEKPKYSFVYEEYLDTLKQYYSNMRETHRHEVIGENMAYEVEKQYRKKALTDELTGVGNRAAYEVELEEVKSLCVGGKVPENVVIFAFDVNGLKFVNDTYGHQAGDDYIRGAAECLDKAFGSYGHFFRTGGDEYNAVVRVKNFPVEQVMKLLKESLANWTDSYGNVLSMSAGYASSNDYPEKALDELIHLADEEMYKDKDRYYKESGRDRRKR